MTLSRSPPLRSPSLPLASPVRISNPEIQQAQSSFFTPASLPSRWVTSLLSSAVRPSLSRPRSINEDAEDEEAHAKRKHALHEQTLPAVLPSQVTETVSGFSRAVPQAVPNPPLASSIPVDDAITHGTPFASHPFVPASGAPGFAGDREWNKGFEFDKSIVEKKSVRLMGRKEVTTPVLTVEVADMLRPHFPALARLPRIWSLLYSLDQHGISLNTLYARCQSHVGGALLVIRDSGDTLFGAWMGEGIHPSKGSYYGSGESFLWKLPPDQRLRIYKWTGKNDYVALCEPEYLSFGGGEGHYGLYLDNSLIDGSSARCPTFDNDPLCSAGPRQGENVRFECVGLEVWGVG
ncbi:TLD-domain-containing protein [Laetiporus sulphureus 93-53]|uniref:Oxidation resistance protein 1 n=1 Tax=Laetiporus sulphureus 93-53 TaxID=1314785 RepID=A0A165DKZ7_9APHY|nr:TLD-domain-containing protein [Laetiporus sulphureus 93-53]KZT05112.1 TLD-domain-containing protein [Laetiporus sulphureus 93-53]